MVPELGHQDLLILFAIHSDANEGKLGMVFEVGTQVNEVEEVFNFIKISSKLTDWIL